MKIPNHDKVGILGFSVPPEQLAHDLAIFVLSKDPEITQATTEDWIYDKYLELLERFETLIDGKTRYDSSFKK